MDIAGVTTLVTQIGFPIAMCLLMAWYIKYNNDQHRDEMSKITEALNNNTVAVQKLCEKFQ